jgi:AcrR family transcriptional regulator
VPERERGGGRGHARTPDPERVTDGPPDSRRERQAAGRERQQADRERQQADRDRQQADRARQALDRQQQKVDREQQRLDRARQQADQLQQRLDREQQKAGRERQRLSGARQQPGRGRGARHQPEADEHSADHLWPPFGPESASDRGTQAYRLMRKQAERDPRGRGRLAKAQTLSRAEIVDAAIAIADAEGADAVSMRRIAQVLRAGTMSLYWHVANKDHLLDLMIDALMAEVAIPELSGDWRADLQGFARNYRAMLLRHLWVMDFVGGRPPLGPNMLLGSERLMAIFDGAGLDPGTTMNILGTMQTYVMGVALREMREARTQRDQEQSGLTMADVQPALTAWRDRLAADGRLPHFVAFLDTNIDPDAEETRDERFEFGLDCVLDGIAAKVTQLTGRAPD